MTEEKEPKPTPNLAPKEHLEALSTQEGQVTLIGVITNISSGYCDTEGGERIPVCMLHYTEGASGDRILFGVPADDRVLSEIERGIRKFRGQLKSSFSVPKSRIILP